VLKSKKKNTQPAGQMNIDAAYSYTDNTKQYIIELSIATEGSGSIYREKDYPLYIVSESSIKKDFQSDLIIQDILLYFYIRTHDFKKSGSVKRRLKRIFESIISDITYDAEIRKSNRKVTSNLIKF
jgi:hypothetical protein